jgi:hypothetical protein
MPDIVQPTGPRRGHVFNDDLLMNANDLAFARAQFPGIIHLLDHPRLREKFAEYNRDADKARDWVRRLGFGAVVSATLALLAVATEPLWPHTLWKQWLALVMELGGLLAALVAGGGLLLGPWKRQWLESRLMAERLRQWHFQLLVRHGKEVEASCAGPDAIAQFEKERGLWLDKFLQAHEGKLEAQLESFTDEPGDAGDWLHDPPTLYSHKSAALAQVFDAFEQLRFDRQYNYAVYKLRRSSAKPFWQFLKWPAMKQMAALSDASSFCFTCALICSAILIYGYAVDVLAGNPAIAIPPNAQLCVRTSAIAVAIIGAALRTIQEGLSPDREIERYKHYRGRTFQLRERFKQTTDAKERLHLMEELELASVDEMRGFLRTHYNARFILA